MTVSRRGRWFLDGVFACLAFLALHVLPSSQLNAEPQWNRWRGPNGNAVLSQARLPLQWNRQHNVLWKEKITGEGASSPIVWKGHLFLTAATRQGQQRWLYCLNLHDGKTVWSDHLPDSNPEITSALTGHAAATPVTDGESVVAFFGNAGVACWSLQGKRRWHRKLGEFETELGLASSPILDGNRVILVCDHDGAHFRNFDSYLIALDLRSGETLWKTDRRKLFRSWSTPVVLPGKTPQLIVPGQDQLRAYDSTDGSLLWSVDGLTEWVTPSPVWDAQRVYVTSGTNGATMAIERHVAAGGTEHRLAWKIDRGGSSVCSPLLTNGRLYALSERGILQCFHARSGRLLYRQRLPGKFTSSPVAADGKLFFLNEDGLTYVVAEGDSFRLLAKNPLEEECLASPALTRTSLLIRTRSHLYHIGTTPAPNQPQPNDPRRH